MRVMGRAATAGLQCRVPGGRGQGGRAGRGGPAPLLGGGGRAARRGGEDVEIGRERC